MPEQSKTSIRAAVAWDKEWRLWVVLCPHCGELREMFPEREDAETEARNHRCEVPE